MLQTHVLSAAGIKRVGYYCQSSPFFSNSSDAPDTSQNRAEARRLYNACKSGTQLIQGKRAQCGWLYEETSQNDVVVERKILDSFGEGICPPPPDISPPGPLAIVRSRTPLLIIAGVLGLLGLVGIVWYVRKR